MIFSEENRSEIAIEERAKDLFGRIYAMYGLIGCVALGGIYISIDILGNEVPFFKSILDLSLAVIASLISVGILAILAWVFIGKKLLAEEKDISEKEIEVTGSVIRRLKAKPIPTMVFPRTFKNALSQYEKSIHIAVLTAEATKYYTSAEIKALWIGDQSSRRRRMIVLLSDIDGSNSYPDLYKENLPKILAEFERNGEVFLVHWDDLESNVNYHASIKDCAVFSNDNLFPEFLVFTNFIGKSFLRLTKSPFRAYQLQSSSYARRIIRSFEAVTSDLELRDKSNVLLDLYKD